MGDILIVTLNVILIVSDILIVKLKLNNTLIMTLNDILIVVKYLYSS